MDSEFLFDRSLAGITEANSKFRDAALVAAMIPMISAACDQVIFFAKARKITSWIFIVRSTAACG